VADTEVTWVGEAAEGPPGVLLAQGGEHVRLEGFEHRW
jgi:hypothetical protein